MVINMRVVLFSDFELPDSCANATRVFAFAKMLISKGHNVDMIGICYDQTRCLSGEYCGIRYRMLEAPNYKGLCASKRISCITEKINLYLSQLIKEGPIDCIILSNIYYDYAYTFIKFAQKNNVSLAINAVEWYDSNDDLFRGILGKIKLIKNRVALYYIFFKIKNIIAISDYLGDYYRSRGCNVIVIPTVLDLKEYSDLEKKDNKKLIVSYAGSPAKKDLVINVVKALKLIPKNLLEKLEIHFYGADENKFLQLGLKKEELEKLKHIVVFHGRIPYESVKSKIASSDFTVLLRPNKRYANAGFPTKVGESMACGTPIIANITSTLGKYIIDNETGIICKSESVEDCKEALLKALALDKSQQKNMERKSLDMAKHSFDYNVYSEDFCEFLSNSRKA